MLVYIRCVPSYYLVIYLLIYYLAVHLRNGRAKQTNKKRIKAQSGFVWGGGLPFVFLHEPEPVLGRLKGRFG